MIAKNAGHIINIGSIAGHQVYPKGAVYCATKYAVNALSQGLRLDLFGTKIRVSTVDPGAVQTNFSMVRFKGDVKKAAAVYEGIEALTPNDIADAILYCCLCMTKNSPVRVGHARALRARHRRPRQRRAADGLLPRHGRRLEPRLRGARAATASRARRSPRSRDSPPSRYPYRVRRLGLAPSSDSR